MVQYGGNEGGICVVNFGGFIVLGGFGKLNCINVNLERKFEFGLLLMGD
jgi:hypothetical protein